MGLVGRAGLGGRELMTARAKRYYLRFFELHPGRDDELAMRAALGIQKIGGEVPEPPAPAEPPTSKKPKPGTQIVRIDLEPGEEITDLKLAEFVAANPGLTVLTRKTIGSAQQITDLRPLARLTKLKTLELSQASNLKDLSPLAALSNLTYLSLSGLETEDISALASLSKLTTLNISGARNVSDLTPVGRLLGLRTLTLTGCKKVSDVTPLSRLAGLRALKLSGCENVTDLSPLTKCARSLTGLDLTGCASLSDIYPLAKLPRLRTLNLRKCGKIAEEDLVWLQRRLSDCKIQSAASRK